MILSLKAAVAHHPSPVGLRVPFCHCSVGTARFLPANNGLPYVSISNQVTQWIIGKQTYYRRGSVRDWRSSQVYKKRYGQSIKVLASGFASICPCHIQYLASIPCILYVGQRTSCSLSPWQSHLIKVDA